MATVRLSALDVAGMGNFVGKTDGASGVSNHGVLLVESTEGVVGQECINWTR